MRIWVRFVVGGVAGGSSLRAVDVVLLWRVPPASSRLGWHCRKLNPPLLAFPSDSGRYLHGNRCLDQVISSLRIDSGNRLEGREGNEEKVTREAASLLVRSKFAVESLHILGIASERY